MTDLRKDEVTVLEDGMKRETLNSSPSTGGGACRSRRQWCICEQSLVQPATACAHFSKRFRKDRDVAGHAESSTRAVSGHDRTSELIQGIDLVTPDSGAARFARGCSKR